MTECPVCGFQPEDPTEPRYQAHDCIETLKQRLFTLWDHAAEQWATRCTKTCLSEKDEPCQCGMVALNEFIQGLRFKPKPETRF